MADTYFCILWLFVLFLATLWRSIFLFLNQTNNRFLNTCIIIVFVLNSFLVEIKNIVAPLYKICPLHVYHRLLLNVLFYFCCLRFLYFMLILGKKRPIHTHIFYFLFSRSEFAQNLFQGTRSALNILINQESRISN